jgi:translation initiation factor IF-2
MKVRVYQLAKELKVQSVLILELLDRLGREVKSDLSTLDDDTANLVRNTLLAAIDRERAKLADQRRHEPEAETAPAHAPGGTATAVAESEETEHEAPRVDPAEREPAVAAEGEVVPPARTPEVEPVPVAATPHVPVPAPPVAPPRPAVATAPAAAAPEPTIAYPMPPPLPSSTPRGPRVFPARRMPPGPGAAARPPMPPSRPPAGRVAPPVRPDLGRPTRPMGAGAPAPRPGPGAVPGAPPAPSAGTPRPAPGAPPRDRGRKRDKVEAPPPLARPKPDLPPVPEKVVLSEAVTVKELAEKLNRKSKDVIAKLIARGVLATINQPLDPNVAVEVAKEFGSEASIVSFEEQTRQESSAPAAAELVATTTDRQEDLRLRPPVVTVMGHVDHGKTSLLDAIRTTNVVDTEHGGITQHIGAYQVVEKGRKITFLDTPGHEAFTMMRARGARVTDIVVLVVAADDGVRPQTLEAIDHAKAAGVPIVVAINKVDKPEARPERVKQQLADRELLVEEYGGQTVAVEVSAKKRTGLDDLLDMVLLVADIQDLKANPAKLATGVVLEARLDRARGTIATVLVQDGTLKVGDPFIAGSAHGKVRAMADAMGKRVEEAGPAVPVEVMGFAGEPAAGDLFQAVADEAKARQIASFRLEKARVAALARSSRRSLEALSRQIAEGQAKELSILLKADVQGSLEALQKSISELPQDKVRINLLRSTTGAITQADVLLSAASEAIIVGFNVRPDRATADLASKEEVEVRLYTVIYDLINELRQAMVGMLEPTLKENVLGQAEVRQLFKVPKVGTIAGCYVVDGNLKRSAEVRLLRDNVVIYTGKVGSLRRFKDDVSEVKQGFECGIGIANFNDLKEGDVIEFFVVEKIAAQTL